MSYMKKLPSNPTRDQIVAWKIQNGECGLLPADWTVLCPKRGGPVNPNPDHPRLVGFPGENGYCTCSGCQYFLGLEFDSYVCTHPNARAVAARALAETIRRWEEEQGLLATQATMPQPRQKPEPESETPDQAAGGQLSLSTRCKRLRRRMLAYSDRPTFTSIPGQCRGPRDLGA